MLYDCFVRNGTSEAIICFKIELNLTALWNLGYEMHVCILRTNGIWMNGSCELIIHLVNLTALWELGHQMSIIVFNIEWNLTVFRELWHVRELSILRKNGIWLWSQSMDMYGMHLFWEKIAFGFLWELGHQNQL